MRSKTRVDQQNKKSRKVYRVLLYTVASFLVIGAAYGGYVGAKFYQALNQIQDVSDMENEEVEDNVEEEEDLELVKKRVRNGNTISIMIAGVDSEHGRFVGRSDVLMVAAIDLDNGESSLLSIPRDTYVEIAGTGEYDKINHAYAKGVNTAVDTVEKYLDIPIDYHVSINFTGFVRFIDFLGGIELDVERRIFHNLHPDRVYLYPGVQKVNGTNALEYVRFRADNEGDFGRNRRQQQVLKEVLNQTTSLRTVTRVPEVLDIMGDNIRTNMDTSTMLSLVRNLSSLTGDNVESLRLTGDGMMINGVYYVDVDEEVHQEVVEQLQERMKLEYEKVAKSTVNN